MNLRFFLQTFLTDLLRFKGTIDAGKEQSRIGFPLKFREIGTSKLRDYLKAALYELKLCDFDVVGIHRNSVKGKDGLRRPKANSKMSFLPLAAISIYCIEYREH